jgi:putative endonuclease
MKERYGTLYTGMTSDLIKRVAEMPAAILREKQIKAGSRAKKIVLIETFNPTWEDVYETII